MCHLWNIGMRDYQESVTIRQTQGQTDAGQSDPFVPLCFAGDTKRVQVRSAFAHVWKKLYLEHCSLLTKIASQIEIFVLFQSFLRMQELTQQWSQVK